MKLKLSRADARAFLKANGFSFSRMRASHEVWKKPGAPRSAVVDFNCEPLFDEHIRTILKCTGKSRDDLRTFLGQ